MDNLFDVLKERGFIDDVTGDEVRQMLTKPVKVYSGFDPSADSLHLGNLVAIMGLAWFQRYGHTPIALVGGATGMIGDPSGKSAERTLLDKAAIEKNLQGIKSNLETILGRDISFPAPTIVNNLDWLECYSVVDFLRDVGKNFRLGVMLSKESVRSRLNSEEGMSFTEFSYQLLQGYDFLHLYDQYGVTLQIGGSDQWGNIVAGKDLVRKMRSKTVEGMTFPLITRSDGKKFGKSESGTIWLSPEKISPYDFYQYLYRMPDADVIKLMSLLTFMDMEEIRHYQKMMETPDYQPNTAQKKLAEEVTRIVHGEKGLELALKITASAAPGAKTELDASVLEILTQQLPTVIISLEDLNNKKYLDLLVDSGLVSSKSEGRRLIKSRGAYLNNKYVTDENLEVQDTDLVDNLYLLLGAGKKKKAILKVSWGK
ncbi:MAG: tyrosine--tRNA ligase [Chlamydiota bacterium]